MPGLISVEKTGSSNTIFGYTEKYSKEKSSGLPFPMNCWEKLDFS